MTGLLGEAGLWGWRNKIVLTASALLAWALTGPLAASIGLWLPATPGLDDSLVAAIELFAVFALALAVARTRAAAREVALREETMRRELGYDALTGLLNRRALFGMLSGRQPGPDLRAAAILYVDLDGFKLVNDTLGHAAGDDLLVELAGVMRRAVGERGALARLGGDEFAVLADACGLEEAQALAGAVIEAVLRHDIARGLPVRVGASIGIACAPLHGAGTELLRRADIALYEAKRQGRGRAVAFDIEMEKDINYRSHLHRDMRAGWLMREMSVVYQPIWSGDGATMRGVEALMRWMHPVRGPIPPSHFIPVAEETGLIRDLGAWVLETACRDARAWGGLFVSVNLSPVQLRAPDIVADIVAILERTGFAPDRLVVEITEGVLIRQSDEAIAKLAELRSRGVRIALDDFGTGYSSLAYLKRFPVDKLKIDRSFIEGATESADDAALLGAIIGVGRALGMTVVAEGVETAAQHRVLRAFGCGEIQGFLFSRPRPAAEIAPLLPAPSQPLRIAC